MTAYTWAAAADGDADVGTNWSPTGVPTTGDTVTFNGTSVKNCNWNIADQITTCTVTGAGAYTGTITISGVNMDVSGNCNFGTDAIGAQPSLNTGANKLIVGGTTNIYGGTVTINGAGAALEAATITIHNPFGNVVLDGTSANAFFSATSCVLENSGRFTIQNNGTNAVSLTGNTSTKCTWSTALPVFSDKVNIGSAANKGVDFSTNSLAFNPSTATVTTITNPSDMGNFTMNAAGTLLLNCDGNTFKSYTQSAGTTTPSTSTRSFSCAGDWEMTAGTWTDSTGVLTINGTGDLAHVPTANRLWQIVFSGTTTSTLTGTFRVRNAWTEVATTTINYSSGNIVFGTAPSPTTLTRASGATHGTGLLFRWIISAGGTATVNGTFDKLQLESGGTTTFTLGAALVCNGELVIETVNGRNTQLNTNSSNYAVTCGGFRFGADTGTLTANASTITNSGDWDSTATSGTFTAGTSTVNMTGTGDLAFKSAFYNFTASGTVTLVDDGNTFASSSGTAIVVSGELIINTGQEFLLANAASAVLNTTSGTISGAGDLVFRSSAGDYTLHANTAVGTISADVVFRAVGSSGTPSFTLAANFVATGDITLDYAGSGTSLEVSTSATNYTFSGVAMSVDADTTLTCNASTVTYTSTCTLTGTINCTATPTVSLGALVFASSGVLEFTGSTTVLTITNGDFDMDAGGTFNDGSAGSCKVVMNSSTSNKAILPLHSADTVYQFDKDGSFEKATVNPGSITIRGGLVVGSDITCSINITGSAFRVQMSASTGFNNSGTIDGTVSVQFIAWFGVGGNRDITKLGTLSNSVAFVGSTSLSSNVVWRITQNELGLNDISVSSSTGGGITSALDTNDGTTDNNLTCVDITTGTDGILIGNTSTITSSGHVDFSLGDWQGSSATLKFNGSVAQTLTTAAGNKDFGTINCSGSNTVTKAGAGETQCLLGLIVGVDATFSAGNSHLYLNDAAIDNFDVSGDLDMATRNLNLTTDNSIARTLTFGSGSISNSNTMQVWRTTNGAGDNTITLGGNFNFGGSLLVRTSDATDGQNFNLGSFTYTCTSISGSDAGGGLTMNGGSGIINASGNVDLSIIGWTSATSTLNMSGISTTLTLATASATFATLNITNTVTLQSKTPLIDTAFSNTSTFTLSGVGIVMVDGGAVEFDNSAGTITGGPDLGGVTFRGTSTASRTIDNFGTLDTDVRFQSNSGTPTWVLGEALTALDIHFDMNGGTSQIFDTSPVSNYGVTCVFLRLDPSNTFLANGSDLTVAGAANIDGTLQTGADAAGAIWSFNDTVTVAGTMQMSASTGAFSLALGTKTISVRDLLTITTHTDTGDAVMSIGSDVGYVDQTTRMDGGRIVTSLGVDWNGLYIESCVIGPVANMRGAWFGVGMKGIANNHAPRSGQRFGHRGMSLSGPMFSRL